jgi:hypothetical protein
MLLFQLFLCKNNLGEYSIRPPLMEHSHCTMTSFWKAINPRKLILMVEFGGKWHSKEVVKELCQVQVAYIQNHTDRKIDYENIRLQK